MVVVEEIVVSEVKGVVVVLVMLEEAELLVVDVLETTVVADVDVLLCIVP